MTCITKQKVNTCKNESSGERERENERAGNQFKKKSIRPPAMLSDF